MHLIKRCAISGFSIILVGIILVFISFCIVGFNVNGFGNSDTEMINNDYVCDYKSHIIIDVSVGSLNIRQSKDDKIWLHTSESDSLYYEGSFDEDNFYVKQLGYANYSRSTNWNRFSFKNFFSMDFAEYTCTVELPSQLYTSVSVKLLAGDVSISDLNTNKLKVVLADGDAEIKAVDSNEIKTEIMNGSIAMKLSNAENCDVSTNYGDIDLSGVHCDTLNTLISGNGSVYFYEVIAQDNTTLSITNGRMIIKDFTSKNAVISGTTASIDLLLSYRKEDYLVTCQTRLGDCNVENTEKGSNKVTITISTGNIKVDFKNGVFLG